MKERLERLIRRLGIPEDVISDTPMLELEAFRSLHILHYQGILELSDERIRIGTSIGEYIIDGTGLRIELANHDEMVLCGRFTALTFCAGQEE